MERNIVFGLLRNLKVLPSLESKVKHLKTIDYLFAKRGNKIIGIITVKRNKAATRQFGQRCNV